MGSCVQAAGDAGVGLGHEGGATDGFTRGRRLLSDSEAEQGWGRTSPDARGAGNGNCDVFSCIESVRKHDPA